MKRTLLFILLFLPMLSLTVKAQYVVLDDVLYYLDDETLTARVAGNESKKISGNVDIPETVSNNGNNYSVTSIGDSAFYFCPGLTSITIPNSVTRIGGYAFYQCIGLTSIKIPNSVTSIGESAFSGCTGLTSIDIPNSVTSLGYGTFAYCNGLTSVTIGNNLTNIAEYAFERCTSLTSVTIGNGVTSIDPCAFRGCTRLTSIDIPNGVTSIGWGAFSYCLLTSVTIPNSVTTIGELAFQHCTKLKDVYCYAEQVPECYSSSFSYSNYRQVTLHVPATSISAYKAVEPWKDFGNVLDYLAQEYYPEGTKWTEIRLDTLKYDSWYSKFGDEWVPNFETVEYYVKGEYTMDNGEKYKCIYTNGPEWTDSLTLGIQEGKLIQHNEDDEVIVTTFGRYNGAYVLQGRAPTYQFDWSVGKGIYYEDLLYSMTTGIPRYCHYYGIIDEIKEGYFGGVRPLKYVDLDGKAPECGKWEDPQNVDTQGGCIIQGIGITEWNDGECLFGAPRPYGVQESSYEERHYRSKLVHFERNGEVLYDVWPEAAPKIEYRPFIEDGKVWAVKVYPDGYGMVRDDSWTEYYYFDGDTIIGGQTCKQMKYVTNANEENWVNGMFKPANLLQHYIGAWYEQDKKVYLAFDYRQQFELLYDFTLSTGDSITNYIDDYKMAVSKHSGSIPGFKGTYYDIEYGYGVGRWFEGVGSESWPYQNYPWGICGHTGILLSCRTGDEILYYNSDLEDPFAMGARKDRFDFSHTTKDKPKSPMRGETEASETKTLYGEYNELQLGINLEPLDEAYQVCITDKSDKTVYEKAINAINIVGLNIDISSYEEGHYTVTVDNSRETFTGQFEIHSTSIKEVRNNTSEPTNRIYNLQGQRISSLQKGLNIVNGQKVLSR